MSVLDYIASGVCLWVSLVLFGIHVVSSPKRHNWMAIPEYIRYGVVITGALFLWRGINFSTLMPEEPGHINAEGMMALGAIAYTLTASAFWIASKHLPNNGWFRVGWVAEQQRTSPDSVPIMVSRDEVTTIATLSGIPTVGPDANPKDLIAATRRARH